MLNASGSVRPILSDSGTGDGSVTSMADLWYKSDGLEVL